MRALPYIICLGLTLLLSLLPFNWQAQMQEERPLEGIATDAPAQPVAVRYVEDEVLNVFAGPGHEFELVNKLTAGEQVIALDDSLGWTQIAYTHPTDTGYVVTQRLAARPPDQLAITDWQWHKDPKMGAKGAIVYEGSIENNTDQFKHFIKLKLITYDAEQQFVSAAEIYIPGKIPPFGQRRFSGTTAANGNEHNAIIKVSVNN